MLHTLPRPKFSSISLYDEPFLSYGPIFGKVHRMTPNALDMFKVKNTKMHITNTPEAQIFVRFDLRWAVLEIQRNFRKSAPNNPNWPWHVQSQKYQHACYIQPLGPNFRPFCSTRSGFWVAAQFSEKCTEWPQITLTCSRSKIPTCMLYAHQGLNFRPLRSTRSGFWVTAQFSEKCTKWIQMTLTRSRSKIPTYMLHIPPRPKFSSVSLYEQQFLSYGPIFGKVHRMTPTHLDMFKVKNTNRHVTYTAEAQIFVRFALRWAVFELRPNFRKSAQNDPKSPWHVQGQKYQQACYIHCRGPNLRPFRSTMSHIWVTALFLEKCTEWPQMTLTCSRSEIPTYMLHLPTRPKFSSVLLYDKPFLSYGPIFGKVHWMTPNDLDMYKVKNTNLQVQ